MSDARPVVIAGASGFVGRNLVDLLLARGRSVRGGTRDPARARAARPEVPWVVLDVDDDKSLFSAFEGADALVFLVHRMRDGGHGLAEAEVRSAERVVRQAEAAGLRRIVYLGGPAPGSGTSEHLRARARTGEVLRGSGRVSTIELRAGMIVGEGSESWRIVRDLAMRLPVMVLPAWLKNRSQPVWIEDVVEALAAAIDDPMRGSAAFDLPGPEVLSAEDMLRRVAAARGTAPRCVRIPVLTPSLSSHWIRLVTRADFSVARKLVDGLTEDLIAADDGYWSRMPGFRRTPFDVAVERALATEPRQGVAGRAWEAAAARLSRQIRVGR